MRQALLVIALAGCDKLLGLSAITASGPAQLVTGDYQYVIAGVDGNQQPIVTDMLPPAGATSFTAFLPDGTEVDVDAADDGTFSFSTPVGSSYRLAVQDIDQQTATEYQSAEPSMHLRRRFQSRIDARPATLETDVTFHLMAGEVGTPRLVSTGVRSYSAPESGGTTDPTIDWSHTGVGLLSAAEHDRLIYELFADDASGQYGRVSEWDVEAVEMTDGQPTTIGTIANPVVPTALAADHCVGITTRRAEELTRFETITADTTSPFSQWEVFSTVSSAMGPGGELLLADATSAATDDDLEVHYASPYPGEVDVVQLTFYTARTLQLPTTPRADLVQNIEQLAMLAPPASPPCPGNVVSIGTGMLAMIASASIGGQALTSDAQSIAIDRSAPIEITYSLSDGTADFVSFGLYELVAFGSQTVLQPVRFYVGASPVAVDPALLLRGHHYVLTANTFVGYAGAPQLDFTVISYPYAASTIFLPTFVISN